MRRIRSHDCVSLGVTCSHHSCLVLVQLQKLGQFIYFAGGTQLRPEFVLEKSPVCINPDKFNNKGNSFLLLEDYNLHPEFVLENSPVCISPVQFNNSFLYLEDYNLHPI